MQSKSKNINSFKPPLWARNRHIQTIWPRFFTRRLPLRTEVQRLDLPDGDFIDLAWSPRPDECKGLIPMFHGLEGSINSHYANDMIAQLNKDGWWVVLMHFRGCSGSINRLPRSYHSGDTDDARFFLEYLHKQQFDVPIQTALGFSLGANMLLKLIGEEPNHGFFESAVAISPPFKLSECSKSISEGFSRIYQNYLLASMRRTFIEKIRQIDFGKFKITNEIMNKIRTFRDFDEYITAPLHGFENAEDYYSRSSCIHYLNKITTPTLIIHSKDDPFMNSNVVPQPEHLSEHIELELSEQGGHVGFMQGSPWRPKIWFHDRVKCFLDTQLANIKIG
ncbi:hydrolase [Alteromonas sp. a30]|uniref:hydrolase n=1 Tax=Alteromonas sp. a30 TaxID=2730917 RepID=UPI00227F3281|nr:hydrolase [Alteromonas sp. a30]MCY7295652.1 hydrolase [Alteromonas sp. a30]